MTLQKARSILAELRTARMTGQGEVTLRDKREKAERERQAEKDKIT